MSEVTREFRGGVWAGQVRAVDEEATEVFGNTITIGTTSQSIGELWSGYALKGATFVEVKTGTREECRKAMPKLKGGVD